MASRAGKLRAVPAIAANLLALIDAMELMRGQIATVTDKKPGSIELGLAKDGIAFDLTVPLSATDDAARLGYKLESQPLEGMVFSSVSVLPPLGRLPRRLTARIGAPA